MTMRCSGHPVSEQLGQSTNDASFPLCRGSWGQPRTMTKISSGGHQKEMACWARRRSTRQMTTSCSGWMTKFTWPPQHTQVLLVFYLADLSVSNLIGDGMLGKKEEYQADDNEVLRDG